MGRPFALRHVYALMRSAINRGDFPPPAERADRGFSEEEAIDFFGASRTEAREALAKLSDEGILVRAPRRGSSVIFTPISWSLTDGLSSRDRHRVEVQVIGEPSQVDPAPALNSAFGREVRDVAMRVEVFLVDGERVCLRTSYWIGNVPGREVILPSSDASLAEGFEHEYGVPFGELESDLSATTADLRQAGILGVPVGEALLWRQTEMSDERGVIWEISHSFYVASRMYFRLSGKAEEALGI